ncbi:serine hydrolase domain-containing protein [Sporolactobacillus pectinivorans]|uniref:serine hydrolase domain-containing protein n=1 Tax=Sporolactobacillus pectinivorans TaxID=1591408 RepID=UPI000C256C7F|nr:serine hydrolase domain-containing protein [Sporolactobacillus pectinivorans]
MKKQRLVFKILIGILVLVFCSRMAVLIFWQHGNQRNSAASSRPDDFVRQTASLYNIHKNGAALSHQTVSKAIDHSHTTTTLKAKKIAPKESSLTQKIDITRTTINRYLHRVNFTGTAVVVSHGQTVLARGYGYRNVALRLPNMPSTEYYVASITKSVTAVAFMQMREHGLISFNDRVSQFYPNFPNGRSISMLDLLCHVSGLRGIPETIRFVTRDEQVQRIADGNLRLSYRPGTQWSYEDDNYTLVAAILDRISLRTYGKTLHQYIQQNIFNKANMTQAGFGEMSQSPYRSIGYAGVSEQIPSLTQLLGCGDVYMSAWDLYLFDHALADGTLLSAPSYQSIFKRHFSVTAYSLGWYPDREGWGKHTYSSHGVLGGWNGSNAFSMDRQNFVVLLSNSSSASGIYAQANQMIFNVLSK